jgi:sugar lactone lactonase YvrE
MRAALIQDAGARLGEGPLWVEGGLEWVDVPRGRWERFDTERGPAPGRVLGDRLSALAPRASGGRVVAVDGAIVALDPAGERSWEIPVVAPGGGAVLNDAGCDRRGRLWVGTAAARSRGAALYRIDAERSAHVGLSGLTMSNGLDWSPGGDRLYHVDSVPGVVRAFAYDADRGRLGPGTVLVEIPSADGVPDGLAVDAEGTIWVAIWGAGQVRRYDPQGRRIGTIVVPASQVTSCAFGGPGLHMLWITTAREGLDAASLRAEPHAGGLFVAEPGTVGLAPAPFAD